MNALQSKRLDESAIRGLASQHRGELIQPGDGGYEAARKVYNGMIDRHPSLIARSVDAADVIAAVTFARSQELPLAIRGGGHNGPGLGTVDDGLVIDLSPMKGVRVDLTRRTVRVEAGCTSGDVDHATHAFGLAVPYGIVSTTGVDRFNWMRPKDEAGHHAEVASTAAQRPEEIRVLPLAGGDELAVRQDHVDLEQVVDRQTVLAREIPGAAPE
ncbi:MAG TPA: FAD-binding protein, partial [Acidimicrobiales bacterium]|nr:FAD-binding protein [Acidimicrobiales bacterium]